MFLNTVYDLIYKLGDLFGLKIFIKFLSSIDGLLILIVNLKPVKLSIMKRRLFEYLIDTKFN